MQYALSLVDLSTTPRIKGNKMGIKWEGVCLKLWPKQTAVKKPHSRTYTYTDVRMINCKITLFKL